MEYITPTFMCDHLGIQPITLRRWCATYAAHLSPTANPSPGTARRFTGRDLEVFRHVRSLRGQGVSVPNIAEQLAGLTFAEVDHNETNEGDTNTTEISLPGQQEGLQQAPAFMLTLEAMRNDIAALQQAKQEEQRDRVDRFNMLGIGVCIGLLVALIIFVVGWLYGAL